jgi:putative oxidoreductase
MFRWIHQPDIASLILRLMLASIFIAQGGMKVARFEGGTAWYHGDEHMPAALQATVAWAELVIGIALGIGLMTRWAALGLIVIMIGAIYKVTWRMEFTIVPGTDTRGFIVHEVGYEYNYAIIAMSVCLVILGGGNVSIDQLLWHRKSTHSAAPPVPANAPVTANP